MVYGTAVCRSSVADPGFLVCVLTHWGGGADLQRGHFSMETYAKAKELGPVDGSAPGPTNEAVAFIGIPLYNMYGLFCSIELHTYVNLFQIHSI